MSESRRQFLKTALLGTSATVAETKFVRSLAAEEAPAPKNPFSDDPVALRKLTDRITCSRIGLGTGVCGYERSSNLTRMDRSNALDVVRYCYDVGIRLFDMADLYGTHGLIREALAGKPRDSYTLFTKIWGHPTGLAEKERPDGDVVLKRFLEELGTDYVDLVQIHCMSQPDWPNEFGRYFDSLEKLKEQGIIRGHGVSCHALSSVQTAAEHPWVDAIHLRMNTANARMDGTLDENMAAAKLAHKNGKGIIVMKVLGEGAIKDPTEQKKSISTIVGLEAADVMVVGLESREQIDIFLANTAEALKNQAKS